MGRVDGDAAGGVAEGGLQQPGHATLPFAWAVVAWGFGPIFVKLIEMPGLTLAVYRLWLGFALMVAIALISALTSQAIKHDVAMTGEITLRGRVLPVGGIKEKVLGAHRAGIRTVILPRNNERDIDEVPGHVKRRLAFIYVEHMDDVIASAFCAPPEIGQPAKPNGRRNKTEKLAISS